MHLISEAANEAESGAIGSMTQQQLARRLGVHPSTLGKWKYRSEFRNWSRARDPEGLAWEFRGSAFSVSR